MSERNRMGPAKIRVLVIGAGPTTMHAHLPVLARLRDRGEILLAIICDLDRGRATAARTKFGFLEDCGDASAALKRSDVDAVYIFASAQLHYELGLMALNSGKHLFVEKPIAPSYSQAVILGETARVRGLTAVGGLNRRFFKSLAAARENAGKAGWRYAEAVFHKAEFGNAPLFGSRTWLSANGIHALDALLYMMGGLPAHVTALTGESTAAAPGAFSAVMRWHDGAQGVFLCNNNAGCRREQYVFHGVGETCSIDDAGITIEKKNKSIRRILPSIGDGFAAEHEAFLAGMRDGTEPAHSIAALAPSLFLAELIESGFSGPVALPQSMPPPDRAADAVDQDAILVAQPAELQGTLADLLRDYRIISLQDLLGSAASRPDIVAAILGRGSSPLPREVLAKLPRLRVVGIVALSVARHEPQSLLDCGITIVNASAAYAASVAEFALAVAVLARRRAFASHSLIQTGEWGTDPSAAGITGFLRRSARHLRPALKASGLNSFVQTLWLKTRTGRSGALRKDATAPRDLRGAVVGLLGWGETARTFAGYLLHAGAKVLVFSEHAGAESIREVGALPASLAEVLAADIVSLHRGLTAHTRHFLGEAELAKLRPGAVLINTARGALIEPKALLARLMQKDIFACIDSFEEEPLPAAHPLRRMPNVFLTAHIAGGSQDMHAAAAAEVIKKVVAVLAGESVLSISAQRLRAMT
jgi:phosphoglycerate dehydrogenase-like enzyme/predicted dehydrogenase